MTHLEALEEVIKYQKEKIDRLEKDLAEERSKITFPNLQPMQPFIGGGILQSGCQHEYPNPWMSITAPHCKKCGEIQPSLPQFTWSVTNSAPNAPNQTSGYMQISALQNEQVVQSAQQNCNNLQLVPEENRNSG